ncbi:MAG: hypothetical protein V1827_01370 [Candidatus Micrarchaeota archaeon]
MQPMRGFVITILSMSLIMILVVLSMSLRSGQMDSERSLAEPLPLLYASSLVDDVAYDLNSIVGPDMAFEEQNDSMRLTISDSILAHNHTGDILSYGAFLEGEVAARSASNITANLTNLTNGTIRVFINGDYAYENSELGDMRFSRIGGTGASSYEINVTVPAVRTNITPMAFNTSGTLNVTIRYTDLNGTGTESGAVFPDAQNILRLDYENGTSLSLGIGLEGGEGGSLHIEAEGVRADASWLVVLPPMDPEMDMGYEYDATIGIVQGRAAKRCRIGK